MTTTDDLPPDVDPTNPAHFIKDWIDPDQLVDRGVYEIRSRNLTYGVFRAETKGFIGIREKFAQLYLFEEYEHDSGGMFGTARAVRYVCPLLDEIEMRETYPSECAICRQPCEFNEKLRGTPGGPWKCEGGCEKPSPVARNYAPLFDFLLEVDPDMARCEACGQVVCCYVPYDYETRSYNRDIGYWSHIGRWEHGRMTSDADHEPALPGGKG